MLLERNGPREAEHFRVYYDFDTEQFVSVNDDTHALCGDHRAVKPEHIASMATELARKMFEVGYQRAQEDMRRALGLFP